MALPSQSARPISIRAGGGGGKRRRRNRGGGFMVGIVLVGIAGGATWWLWPEDTPGEPNPAPSGVIDDGGTGFQATLQDAPPRPEPSPAPGSTAADTQPPQQPDPVTPAPEVATSDAEATEATDGATTAATEVAVAPETPPAAPSALEQAAELMQASKPVEARALLSKALKAGDLPEAEADHIRATLATINEGLVFSREIATGDPFVGLYTIQKGDTLSRIVDHQDLPINWRFLQRINGIKAAHHIGLGQRLKVITAPFHAVVDKQTHRLDLWLGEGDDAVYVRSFRVGLGEFDSTPEGRFRVRKGGKLVNPSWRHPRTGEFFDADDPKNPIGEYWLALEGIEPHNLQEQGFGIHGTIDPDSIGKSESLGCVRLGDEDIAIIYGVLAAGKSTLHVVN